MSPIRVDDDLLPTTTFAIHLTRLNQPSGWLVGEFSLEEMWRMVDQIRIGEHGFALVVAPDGALVAHGDPDKKALVAQSRNMNTHPLVGAATAGSPWQEYRDEDGRRAAGGGGPIDPLNWTVIVEQPTDEAYASATRLQRQLLVAAALALLVMIGAGFVFGRRFIAPIFALQRGTQALSEGKLETRVAIDTADEFGQLGASFNSMADRLVELQENVKRQERQAMFGRVVAGLFHDLNHPIQNIGNNARLLLRDDLDAEGRSMSQRIIERELGTLKRFMDDVLNIAKPRPIERFALDVNASVSEIVEAMRAEGERANVTVSGRYAEGPLTDRRRSLRARPRLPQPDHERDSGDGAGRRGHGHDRARRARRRGDGRRHRLGHSGGSARRPSSTTSSRPSAAASASAWPRRSGSSSSSTARSASRAKSVGARRSPCGSRRPTAAEPQRPPVNQQGQDHVSNARENGERRGRQSDVSGAVLRAADAARAPPLQRGDHARPRRPHHPRRRFGDESRGARDAAGAGDALQQDVGQDGVRRGRAAARRLQAFGRSGLLL